MDRDAEKNAPPKGGAVLTPEELKQRKQRNVAIALGLLAFIVIVFVVTIVRIGGSVAERSF
ncbi:MAG: hypothetical protein AAF936_17890 [Pseudomonadota bacterium]